MVISSCVMSQGATTLNTEAPTTNCQSTAFINLKQKYGNNPKFSTLFKTTPVETTTDICKDEFKAYKSCADETKLKEFADFFLEPILKSNKALEELLSSDTKLGTQEERQRIINMIDEINTFVTANAASLQGKLDTSVTTTLSGITEIKEYLLDFFKPENFEENKKKLMA
jgi:hypothetical protein